MRDVIISVFGDYSPVMSDVLDSEGAVIGEVVASGMAGVDWPYVLGVLGFFLILYSFFRLLGVFFK